MRTNLLVRLLLCCGLSASCSINDNSEFDLAQKLSGNTLKGKDYATYFISDTEAIMFWQGEKKLRRWWIDEGKFCHSTDDISVCEEVKIIGNNQYEFCGRWGCFPANLHMGNSEKLSIH